MSKIMTFLTRDVKENNETRMTAIMVRFFSLIWGMFWLGMLALMAAYHSWGAAFFCLIPVAAYGISLRLTYIGHTLSASTLCQYGTLLFVGFAWWGMNGMMLFPLILWGVLLLVFLASHEKTKVKVLKAVGLLIAEVLLLTVGRFAFIKEPINEMQDHIMMIWTISMLFVECIVLFLGYSQSGLDQEKALIDKNNRILQMASLDPLTKVFNRRAVDEHLVQLEAQKSVSENGCCIAIGDVDFFKQVNDAFGHDAGDEVLRSLAKCFVDTMREYGIVARWGGEEFLFVFENSNGDQAQTVLEDLRGRIEANSITYEGEQIRLTMTFGLEEYAGGAFEETIKRADAKLYHGKQTGRNRVVF